MPTAFQVKDYTGKTIEVPTPTIDTLKGVVAGVSAPADARERAAGILKHVSTKTKAAEHLPQLDQAATLVLCESDARALWSWPEKCRLTTVKSIEQLHHIE